MGITDQDLRRFPPSAELIKTVEEALGIIGDEACQRKAQETLAELFYTRLKRLIKRRYAAYYHIGGEHEAEDDLQRLYLYIFFGVREDSKGTLKENKRPLLTWLENLKADSKVKAEDLNRYLIFTANSYLKHDLPRNIERGRGQESLVGWTDELGHEGTEIDFQAGKERRMQLRARELVDNEKLEDVEKHELRYHVRQCLKQMPSEEAEPLLAKYYQDIDEDFTQTEYAKAIGVSESTVSKRITKGKKTLGNLLWSVCPDLLQKLGWTKLPEETRTQNEETRK